MKKITLFLSVLASVLVSVTGCTALENKAVAIGSGVDAFKLETTGSTSSGTVLPNLIAGGAVNTLATAPAIQEGTQTQVVFVRSRRNSFFGELFGIDASTESISYIGAPNETPEATAARFEAFAKVMKVRENTGTHAKARESTGNAASAPADVKQAAGTNNEPEKALAAPEGPSEAVTPE